MEHRLLYAPVFTVVEFKLEEGEEIVAQPDSMISMTSGIEVTASIGGAHNVERKWWTGFKTMLGGESAFRAVFHANRADQTLLLAPENYGDILPVSVGDFGGLLLTRGSYLAQAGDCKVDVKYGGLKGLMAKTGVFLLHASGTGTVFCQTYGAVVERELAEGERFLIDNRYVVAFSESVKYELVKSSKKLRDAMMSGEGFLNRFTGPGRVIYQTRSKPKSGFLGQLLGAVT
ncbi:MAG: TIGR00266 family protein [Pirellulales bacterium]